MDTTLFRKLYPELVHCNRSLFKKALKPDSQLEVERLREQQKALRRPPQSNDTHVASDAADEPSDDARPKDPADRGHVRRLVRLILALVVAGLLCAGGLRFWNYLQSYESTDAAEIDGHLDPISTHIDGTVVHVYVKDTYRGNRYFIAYFF